VTSYTEANGYQKFRRLMVKHLVKCLIFVSAVFLINQAAQAIEIGEIPPKVELREKLSEMGSNLYP